MIYSDPYKEQVPCYVLAFTSNLIAALETTRKLGSNLDDAVNFVKYIAPRNLCCFGAGFSKKKKVKSLAKYTEKIIKQHKLKDRKPYRENMVMYIDSGGFQCGMGYVPREMLDEYIDIYAKFLDNYKDLYDYAFTLDVPPNDVIYNSIHEVKETNLFTIGTLPERVSEDVAKNKLLFVYHFSSPRIWNSWQDIVASNANKYSTYWSAGGVARYKSQQKTNCWLYTAPILQFLSIMKDYANTDQQLQFHLLGDFTTLAVLFSKIIPEYVRRRFNLNLSITYDATSICVGNLRFRYLSKFDGEYWHNVDVSRGHKHQYNNYFKTSNDKAFLNELQEFAEEIGFPKIPHDSIDDPDKDNFWTEVGHYLILYQIYQYYKLEMFSYELAPQIVDMIFDGKEDEAVKKISDVLIKLNGGKMTDYLKSRQSFLLNTIKYMDSLDDQYVQTTTNYIIGQLKDPFHFSDIPNTLTW